MNIVVFGLSITSSWGNGHATTYRSLIQGLSELGHHVLFLERDQPWYASHRDMHAADYVQIGMYESLCDLKQRYATEVLQADLVIVGSYVPQGVAIGEWVTRMAHGVTAFYDIDTPITLSLLARDQEDYVSKPLLQQFAMYLSFTGGPILAMLEERYGAPRAHALYCSVDAAVYKPARMPCRWDLGYMGTYSDDRQPGLEQLLLAAARELPGQRFSVVGPQYPDAIRWPENVERNDHLAPAQHSDFYNQQRFTLNLTRARMRELGYSPSVRLFEAAACGTPVISDAWPGLPSLFEPGREILIVETTEQVQHYLSELGDDERRAIGERARERVLSSHTGKHRAEQLVEYVHEAVAS